MKSKLRHAPAILLGLALVPFQAAQAVTYVNDTWLDNDRTNQEAGVDSDSDGNIETAWFGSGSSLSTTAGHLIGTVPAGSAAWTTYFTAEGSEATLANAGDTLTVSWTFSMTGINATNNSQGFRLAFVNSPSGSRVTTNASPGNATYAGYSLFMNIGQTLGHANPFQLMERTDPATASALLSSSASWTGLDDEEAISTDGYDDGVSYTFGLTLTRTASAELMINATLSGGTVGDDGQLTVSFVDTTPNSFSFDTFSLRPSGNTLSATTFDTTAFSVALTSIPEPSAFAALVGAAGLVFAAGRRRRSS
jgi:hypothetical protein